RPTGPLDAEALGATLPARWRGSGCHPATRDALLTLTGRRDPGPTGQGPESRTFTGGPMGTQPAAALTETWDVPAPTGLLFLGIDVGRRQHLAAAIPESRMRDGFWERVPVRTIATTALGFRALTGWLGELGSTPDQTRVGLEPTGGWYGRTVASWLERHGY